MNVLPNQKFKDPDSCSVGETAVDPSGFVSFDELNILLQFGCDLIQGKLDHGAIDHREIGLLSVFVDEDV